MSTTIIDTALLLMMAATVIAIARLRNMFGVVILASLYSFLMATIFLVLDAVDVSMTEAAVGAGISTLLYLATLFLIAGPCVIEEEALILDVAGQLREITRGLGVPFIFKASFDKANRSSHESFRGPGAEAGLRILGEVKRQIGVPVLTDVHEDTNMQEVADVVDILQTPAFLCRQTNFIVNVCSQNRPVNIKKGQFLAPLDMVNVVNKARSTGNQQIMVCERGVSFGYNNLVSDMRALAVMRNCNVPVVFDATHSVQLPGGQGDKSGGQREFVPVLARAAVAAVSTRQFPSGFSVCRASPTSVRSLQSARRASASAGPIVRDRQMSNWRKRLRTLRPM